MKIVIQYHEGQWPIDTEKPPEHSLDELLDTFTADEVRSIINESLGVFRGMCDIWNRRERAERRNLHLDAETSLAEEI